MASKLKAAACAARSGPHPACHYTICLEGDWCDVDISQQLELEKIPGFPISLGMWDNESRHLVAGDFL